jgi:hypothetical protein
MSSKWYLRVRCSNQNCELVISPIRAACSAHLNLLYLITLIFGDEYNLRWSSLCNFIQPPVTSFRLGKPTFSYTEDYF